MNAGKLARTALFAALAAALAAAPSAAAAAASAPAVPTLEGRAVWAHPGDAGTTEASVPRSSTSSRRRTSTPS